MDTDFRGPSTYAFVSAAVPRRPQLLLPQRLQLLLPLLGHRHPTLSLAKSNLSVESEHPHVSGPHSCSVVSTVVAFSGLRYDPQLQI